MTRGYSLLVLAGLRRPGVSWRELGVVAAAAWLLVAVRFALARRGYEWTSGQLERVARRGAWTQRSIQPRRLALIVHACARRLPGDFVCLPRSMVLDAMARQRGLETRVVHGVRGEGTAREFHAWVEMAGSPLNERPAVVATYQPIFGPPSSGLAESDGS